MMSEKAKHSPLPWKTITKAEIIHYVIGPLGFAGATLVLQKKADAEFIVHCVNTHDKLVGALERLYNLAKGYGFREIDMRSEPVVETMRMAEAALAEEKP